jgi:hypothetical protein
MRATVLLPLLIAALIANVAVLGIIAAVPRSMQRILGDSPSPAQFVFGSIYQAVWVADQNFKVSPFAVIAALMLPAIAVRRLQNPGVPVISVQQRQRLVIGIPLVVATAMVCVMAPGVYAQGAPPPRALTFASQLLIFGVAVWSIIALPSIQLDLADQRFSSIAQAVAVVVLIGMLVGREINDAPEAMVAPRAYAEAWDAQAAEFHARIERGDPLETVTGLGISSNPNSPTSRCAATFFKSEHLETHSP